MIPIGDQTLLSLGDKRKEVREAKNEGSSFLENMGNWKVHDIFGKVNLFNH